MTWSSRTRNKQSWIKERWKPVKGYEGLYAISSLGRMRGIKGRIIFPCIDRDNHLSVILLDKERKRKKFMLRYLVAEHYLITYSGNKIICINGDHEDCSLGNLRELDIPKHSNKVEGPSLKKTVALLPYQRQFIKDTLAKTREIRGAQATLAKVFGVSRMAITKIAKKLKDVRPE